METHYSTREFELTEELEKYASGKIARLTRKVPRRFRRSAVCEILFKQTNRSGDRLSSCNIALTIGGTKLQAKETTQHMYAAFDIASVDIEQQLRGYIRARRRSLLHHHRKAEE